MGRVAVGRMMMFLSCFTLGFKGGTSQASERGIQPSGSRLPSGLFSVIILDYLSLSLLLRFLHSHVILLEIHLKADRVNGHHHDAASF